MLDFLTKLDSFCNEHKKISYAGSIYTLFLYTHTHAYKVHLGCLYRVFSMEAPVDLNVDGLYG